MKEIELFAEITCPFTHVGLRRLRAERARRGSTEPHLRVRAWPLELVNGQPLDGAGVAEKAAALREQVAPDLFAHVDPETWPSTSRPAFALVEAAYRQGVETGESVSVAVRDALFERGLDISSTDVLDAIAAEHGVGPVLPADDAAIEQDWRAGQQRNVVGSPHFFVGDHDVFCPTLEITRPDGRLHIEIDRVGFESFLGNVFT